MLNNFQFQIKKNEIKINYIQFHKLFYKFRVLFGAVLRQVSGRSLREQRQA